MAATGKEPDHENEAIAQAALEAVSRATGMADTEAETGRRRGRPRLPALRRRLARRSGQAKGVRKLGGTLGSAARRGARGTGRRVSAGSRWLSEQVLAMAPRLPLRGLPTLRGQFPRQTTPDQLADALIVSASRASGAVGMAVGAWAVVPFLPAAGVEIATETLAVVGIEIKLVAELHEVYGLTPAGGTVERATAYVGAWAQRRGVALAPGGLVLAAGSPVARQLQRRLAAKAGRSLLSLGPLLTGAVAGGLINRRETRKLGNMLKDDLRKRSPYRGVWPQGMVERPG
jgi:hypothetical protein